MTSQAHEFADVADVAERLRAAGYLSDEAIATTVFLADRLRKPLLVEGPAGVGKTELAKALAAATGAELIRLQCYEGLDEARALYEWNYKKQLLRIQASGSDAAWDETHDDIFSEEFLLARPLLARRRRDCERKLGKPWQNELDQRALPRPGRPGDDEDGTHGRATGG